jgi:outer membrane protein assembly factor BamE (lipoprotein component of BamABCDE complex)
VNGLGYELKMNYYFKGDVNMKVKYIIFLMIIASLSLSTGCKESKISFNKVKWMNSQSKSEVDIDWDMRKNMAEDLVDKKTLIGKTKSEVIQLLGEPEKLEDIPENELYYLSYIKYGDIDPTRIEYLICTLDEEEYVTNVIYKKTK